MSKKCVVIGATGHVGSYMVPEMVREGFEVTAVARGGRVAYTKDEPEWKDVRFIAADRKALEAERRFGKFIMEQKPDVIVDTICYTLPQAIEMANALRGRVAHYIQIGSIWIYGHLRTIPCTEDHPRNGDTAYGINKALVEKYLFEQVSQGVPATVIHPGHISGRGWPAINPQGNLDLQVYQDLINGRGILLPERGLGTLHHVHSADIASLTAACLRRPDVSIGQAFHATSPNAMTLYGLAEGLSEAFGHTLPEPRFLPWDAFAAEVGERNAACTLEHISKCPSASMEKAKRLLGFTPRYSSMETMLDSVGSLLEAGTLTLE